MLQFVIETKPVKSQDGEVQASVHIQIGSYTETFGSYFHGVKKRLQMLPDLFEWCVDCKRMKEGLDFIANFKRTTNSDAAWDPATWGPGYATQVAVFDVNEFTVLVSLHVKGISEHTRGVAFRAHLKGMGPPAVETNLIAFVDVERIREGIRALMQPVPV